MRCTQIIGLSPAANKFLDENVAREPKKTCPTCGHSTGGGPVTKVYDEQTGRDEGMFDDGPDLWEYTLKNGSVVREVVQASPWASGPCIFLCLVDENGTRIGEWTEREIEGNI